MAFTSALKQKSLSDGLADVCVTLKGNVIEHVQHAKVVSVVFDSHLTWAMHVDKLCSIVGSRSSLRAT